MLRKGLDERGVGDAEVHDVFGGDFGGVGRVHRYQEGRYEHRSAVREQRTKVKKRRTNRKRQLGRNASVG
jgi:hypothetical protein